MRSTVAGLSLLLVCCGGTSGPEPSRAIRVMTFNVLCSFCDDTYDPWEERLAYFHDIFDRHDLDLIGFQEIAIEREVAEVLRRDPEYDAVFYKGEDTSYPDAAIAYRRARFSPVQQGAYWLSPTPEVVYSKGFAPGQQVPRLVYWVRLKDSLSDRTVYFATTHFDNNSPSQELSAPLVVERSAAFAQDLVIVTGDFNSQPRDVAYQTLTQVEEGGLLDTFELSPSVTPARNRTPGPTWDSEERIDHIFLGNNPGSAGVSVSRYTPDLFVYGGQDRLPSDHRAVSATLELSDP